MITSDEDIQWHTNNQEDKNRYVIVRSKLTDFNSSQFLKRVNALIQVGYTPLGVLVQIIVIHIKLSIESNKMKELLLILFLMRCTDSLRNS